MLPDSTTVPYRVAVDLITAVFEKQAEGLRALKWQRGPVTNDRWAPRFFSLPGSEVSA